MGATRTRSWPPAASSGIRSAKSGFIHSPGSWPALCQQNVQRSRPRPAASATSRALSWKLVQVLRFLLGDTTRKAVSREQDWHLSTRVGTQLVQDPHDPVREGLHESRLAEPRRRPTPQRGRPRREPRRGGDRSLVAAHQERRVLRRKDDRRYVGHSPTSRSRRAVSIEGSENRIAARADHPSPSRCSSAAA